MPSQWKEWELKIATIFDNVGFTRVKDSGKPENLAPGTYCMENINHEMQVDIFVCVNDKQWILIECRDRRNRTIKSWLHQIKGRASDRQTKLRKSLKRTDIQVFGVAATSLRNLENKAQISADDTGIALWHHGVVDYLMAITKGARSPAKELVLQRCGVYKKKYDPIEILVQKWSSDKNHWFIGFISPLQIAHAAFVYQNGQGFGESAYQRFLKPQRIGEIAEFVRSGKTFPNSIVLALPSGTKLPKQGSANSLIPISIPGQPEGIKIIDGQHRFYGALASGLNPRLLCTLVQCDDLDQAIMFSKINGKQINVSKSHLVSLFGIPGFAAKIAAGVSQKDQPRVYREELVYRTLVYMNKKGPLHDRMNFAHGRAEKNKIPFKFIFDTVIGITKIEQTGFENLKGDTNEKAKLFAKNLSSFLNSWKKILGEENFFDQKLWLQPTMLSALILLFPECRWINDKLDANKYLAQQKHLKWKPKPENYRGGQGARKLAKALCKKIKLQPKFI